MKRLLLLLTLCGCNQNHKSQPQRLEEAAWKNGYLRGEMSVIEQTIAIAKTNGAGKDYKIISPDQAYTNFFNEKGFLKQ